MSEPTIRERIKKIQVALRDGALSPDLARESLVTLTALLGHCADELRCRDCDYKRVLLSCFEQEQKANRAKLRAETSEEYRAVREAKDIHELVKQMIVSCRAYMRSLDEELRLSR